MFLVISLMYRHYSTYVGYVMQFGPLLVRLRRPITRYSGELCRDIESHVSNPLNTEASGASDPWSEVPQELKDLFTWNPPRLELRPRPDREISTSTPQNPLPAFFEKHFHDELKLLHVKRLPSLVHDIAAAVDNAIIDSLKDGVQLPPPVKLVSVELLDDVVDELEWEMVDEKAVAGFYDQTTAKFCARVASTLALRTPQWSSLLVWDHSTHVRMIQYSRTQRLVRRQFNRNRIEKNALASTSALFVPPPTLSTGTSTVQGSTEYMEARKAVKRKRGDGSSNESGASLWLIHSKNATHDATGKSSPCS